MTKWSVVTNIHWKFEGFLASSFGATKVYYLPFRFKNGVILISYDTTLQCFNALLRSGYPDLLIYCDKQIGFYMTLS